MEPIHINIKFTWLMKKSNEKTGKLNKYIHVLEKRIVNKAMFTIFRDNLLESNITAANEGLYLLA